MTSTNDGKDVKSNQTSGPKGKTYYIELYKSLDSRLSGSWPLRARTAHVCEAWRRVHSLCQHSAPSTHAHLLSWLQRHTAKTVLQTEWQSPTSKDEHATLEEAINDFLNESQIANTARNGVSPPWESQLMQRAVWFKKILSNPWGHPVLRVLLDPRGKPPSDDEILEWLKEERGVMFVTRLRQLAASKCDDLAMLLAAAVMDRVRAGTEPVPDVHQCDDTKDKTPPVSSKPTFMDILKTEAGFTVDVWELLTDIEFVLLYKRDKHSACIDLAKQTPLRNGYQLVERLQSRLETSPREKKLWKNAKEVAALITQVVIARCMVVPVCAGVCRSALYCCARSLVRLARGPHAALPHLRAAAAALAAPAATAVHLHTLAAAVDAQSTEEMKPFVCELYVRAITAGMNELERLKINAQKESEARLAEQMLSAWFTQLGNLLAGSDRIKCECTLTAFSVHPSPAMYERIKTAPLLPPLAIDAQEPKNEATNSEYGSWASDSRSQTNFVKTSETLKLKQTQFQANVLSTALLTEGERLGLGPEVCQDIAVLLSGPRVKTLSWDMDRELLLENCRTYMERTHGGTRALTTELKYLNLDPAHFQHLPEEDDDDTDIYYGIEKGYEHLVEFQEPEEIWQDAVVDPEQTETACSSSLESDHCVTVRRKKKVKKIVASSEEESDPLSLVAEAKRTEEKKERPHSKERSKEHKPNKSQEKIYKPKKEHSRERRKETHKKDKKKEKKERKKRKKNDKKEESKPTAESLKLPKIGSLSSLIGMKIANMKKNASNDATKAAVSSITDSDYDSQGKISLHSLNSEGNDSNVLFDGLYSMDELKSPEKSSHPTHQIYNNKSPVSAKPAEARDSQSKYKQRDSHVGLKDDLNRVPTIPDCLSYVPNMTTVSEEVKLSITKLIHFRRQKQVLDSAVKECTRPETSSSPLQIHQHYSNLNSMAKQTSKSPQAIIKPEITFQSQISPKVVNIPEIPKSYIDKKQVDLLNNELKTEVKELLLKTSKVSNNIGTPVASGGTNVSITNNTVRPKIMANSEKIKDNNLHPNISVNQKQENLGKTFTDLGKKGEQSTPGVLTNAAEMVEKFDTPSQKRFQDFLKELQESINAGAGVEKAEIIVSPQPTSSRKDMKPMSRVTPVLSNVIKAETKSTPQSAKQLVQQKKVENSLNTFSRLSYMHKNKLTDSKIKQDTNTDPRHLLKQRIGSVEIDRVLAEHKIAKMKHLQHKSDLLISRIYAPKTIDKNQISIKKVKSQESPVCKEHPVLSDLLQNQIKHVQIDRPPSVPLRTSSLLEKDQEDIKLLLQQQGKLNALRMPPRTDISIKSTNNVQLLLSSANVNMTSPNTNSYTKIPPPNTKIATPKIKNQIPNYAVHIPTSGIMSTNVLQNVTVKVSQQQPSNVTKPFDYSNATLDPKDYLNQPQQNKVIGNACEEKLMTNKDKKTDWESVMNAILAQKTPSRGPNALEMALKKDSYKGSDSDLRNQRIIRTKSTGELHLEGKITGDVKYHDEDLLKYKEKIAYDTYSSNQNASFNTIQHDKGLINSKTKLAHDTYRNLNVSSDIKHHDKGLPKSKTKSSHDTTRSNLNVSNDLKYHEKGLVKSKTKPVLDISCSNLNVPNDIKHSDKSLKPKMKSAFDTSCSSLNISNDMKLHDKSLVKSKNKLVPDTSSNLNVASISQREKYNVIITSKSKPREKSKVIKHLNTHVLTCTSTSNTAKAENLEATKKILKKSSQMDGATKLCTNIPNNLYASDNRKRQFTCSLPKEDDPFISGIENSDYDLLEELMDDDLRQEIGELSSDEETYRTTLESQKSAKSSVVDKSVHNVVNKSYHTALIEDKLCTVETIHAQQKSLVSIQKSAIQQPSTNNFNSKNIVAEALKTKAHSLSNIEPRPKDVINHDSLLNKPCIRPPNVIRNLPSNIVLTPKKDTKQYFNATNNNVTNVCKSHSTESSNVFLTAVPQQTNLQNVVIIGSELIYDPYTSIQAPVQPSVNSIAQNTYVAYCNAPNMTLFHTTQFAAPAVNPVIIGNAFAMPVAANIPSTIASPIINNTIQSVQPHLAAHQVIVQNTQSEVNNTNVNTLKPSIEQDLNDSYPKMENKVQLDVNLNKNNERKVLSQVQEKQNLQAEKNDTKNHRLSIENDVKKQTLKDQERLKKKRMAILNREICHRCDNKPIPLAYEPLTPPAPCVLDQSHTNQSNDTVTQDINKVRLKLDIPLNHKYMPDKETVSSANLDGNENCKENKSTSIPCRRILLRSSNKLKAKVISPPEVSNNDIVRKTKVKLKDEGPKKIDIQVKTNCEVINNEDGSVVTPKRCSKRALTKKLPKLIIDIEKKVTKPRCKRNKVPVKNKRQSRCKIPKIDLPDVTLIDIEDELLGSKILKITSETITTDKIIETEPCTTISTILDKQDFIKSKITSQPSFTTNDIEAIVSETLVSETMSTIDKHQPKTLNDDNNVLQTNSNQMIPVTLTNADEAMPGAKTHKTMPGNQAKANNNKPKTIPGNNTKPHIAEENRGIIETAQEGKTDNEITGVQTVQNKPENEIAVNVTSSKNPEIKQSFNHISSSDNENSSSNNSSNRRSNDEIILNSIDKNTVKINDAAKDINSACDKIIDSIDLPVTNKMNNSNENEEKNMTKVPKPVLNQALNKNQQTAKPDNSSVEISDKNITNTTEEVNASNNKESIDNIPQSFKDSIVIEPLPNDVTNDPMKKCVRIKLPSGRAFKATVHGSMPVNFDSLFSDPSIKSVLLNTLNYKKKYTLNIKQVTTSDKLNPSKILETRFQDLNVRTTFPLDEIETVNLLSDDEDEDMCQSFKTEFGNYKILAMDKDIFMQHQNKLYKKCCVKLKREILTQSNANEQKVDVSLKNNMENSILVSTPKSNFEPALSVEVSTENSSDLFAGKIVNTVNNTENKLTEKPCNDIASDAINTGNNVEINDVIEIDDSSNDSVDLTSYAVKQPIEVFPKVAAPECDETINELKGLLLKEFGVEESLIGTLPNIVSTISTVNNNTSVQCPSYPDDVSKCVVKVIKCDDLVKKYDTLKIMKRKCHIELVRCDDLIKNTSLSSMRQSEVVEEVQYDADATTKDTIQRHDQENIEIDVGSFISSNLSPNTTTLSRSGSYSILDDFSLFDDVDANTKSESECDRSSPVMEVFEIIACLGNKSINASNIKDHNMKLPTTTGLRITCDSEWLISKHTLSQNHKTVIHEKNIPLYTMTSDEDNLRLESLRSITNIKDQNIILSTGPGLNVSRECEWLISKRSTSQNYKTIMNNVMFHQNINKIMSDIEHQEHQISNDASSITVNNMMEQNLRLSPSPDYNMSCDSEWLISKRSVSQNHKAIINAQNKMLIDEGDFHFKEVAITIGSTSTLGNLGLSTPPELDMPCESEWLMSKCSLRQYYKIRTNVTMLTQKQIIVYEDNLFPREASNITEINAIDQNIMIPTSAELNILSCESEWFKTKRETSQNDKFSMNETNHNKIQIDNILFKGTISTCGNYNSKTNVMVEQISVPTLLTTVSKFLHDNPNFIYKLKPSYKRKMPNDSSTVARKISKINISTSKNEKMHKIRRVKSSSLKSLEPTKINDDTNDNKHENPEAKEVKRKHDDSDQIKTNKQPVVCPIISKEYVNCEKEDHTLVKSDLNMSFEPKNNTQELIHGINVSKIIDLMNFDKYNTVENICDSIDVSINENILKAEATDTSQKLDVVDVNLQDQRDSNDKNDDKLKAVQNFKEVVKNGVQDTITVHESCLKAIHEEVLSEIDDRQAGSSIIQSVKSICSQINVNESISEYLGESSENKTYRSFDGDYVTAQNIDPYEINIEVTVSSADDLEDLELEIQRAVDVDKNRDINIVNYHDKKHKCTTLIDHEYYMNSAIKNQYINNTPSEELIIDAVSEELCTSDKESVIKNSLEVIHEGFNTQKNNATFNIQNNLITNYSHDIAQIEHLQVDNEVVISDYQSPGKDKDIKNSDEDSQDTIQFGIGSPQAQNKSDCIFSQKSESYEESSQNDIICTGDNIVYKNIVGRTTPNEKLISKDNPDISVNEILAEDYASYRLHYKKQLQEEVGPNRFVAQNKSDYNEPNVDENPIANEKSDENNKCTGNNFNNRNVIYSTSDINGPLININNTGKDDSEDKRDLEETEKNKMSKENLGFSDNITNILQSSPVTAFKLNSKDVTDIYLKSILPKNGANRTLHDDTTNTKGVKETDLTLNCDPTMQFNDTELDDSKFSDKNSKCTEPIVQNAQDLQSLFVDRDNTDVGLKQILSVNHDGENLSEATQNRKKIDETEDSSSKIKNNTDFHPDLKLSDTNLEDNDITNEKKILTIDNLAYMNILESTSEDKQVTLIYKDDSGIVLKGIEYEDPEMGTCYMFPLIQGKFDNGESYEIITDESAERISEIDDENRNESEAYFKVIVPNVTYSKISIENSEAKKDSKKIGRNSKRNLKRKIDMTDVKIAEKRYRKGKNIDHPKSTTATINDTMYGKEYRRLFEYCNSLKFSYSRPFHKEHIEVQDILTAWPIKGPSAETNDVIEIDKNLFIDIEHIEKYNILEDPMQKTLAEELIFEYKEPLLSSDINETNFSMGFGEGSGRVIQNLEDGGDISTFSAATLPDVKQTQPFLLSEKYNVCINEQHIENVKNDQMKAMKRYFNNIYLKDKVRSFFRNTTTELHNDWIKDLGKNHKDSHDITKFPFGLNLPEFIEPAPIETILQVVQVGQLPVSAAAQNPVTCDPRVTQVSDASPSQCSAENSPHDDSQSPVQNEYTELTTADLRLPMQEYVQHNQINMESQESMSLPINDENIPIETEIKSVVKIELMEEVPEEKEDQNESLEYNEQEQLTDNHINNIDYSYDTNNTNTSSESDSNMQLMFSSTEKQSLPDSFSQQEQQNDSSEKTDQIAHAMNAAGITTSAESLSNARAQALVNMLSHKIRHSAVGTNQATTNNYTKATSINAMALQQALAQILPPPLNQSNTENNQQTTSNPVTPQVLHIVQGKTATGNQITLVDNTQQSVISTPNSTPVLHIVQNKGTSSGPTCNGTPSQQSNSFGGLSLVDAGLQQGGNQLLHIVNTGNQKSNATGQLLKRVNLLTNLTNVQGSNEQKMVQFVCKSADGKAIQLNAPHQRSMVLRLQPIESQNIPTTPKSVDSQDLSPSPNPAPSKETLASQHEIKSRSVYEENYAKFIQSSSTKLPVPEKSTSLPKFNQAFGKQVFQDGNQKQNEINNGNSHLPPVNNNPEHTECQPTENSISLEHISQISSPPLILRKSPAQSSQSQPNLVQQIKQTIAPMNIQTMHGGVIYTRQIPVNIGGGQTINLITVPSTELLDDSTQKQQSDVKFVNQNELEPSIIKIVPQSQPAPNAEVSAEESNSQVTNDNAHTQQPQPVLTQMRIKLPMLSKNPQMVSGARVVRPSFFQIQRNVIGGANQPVYQQLVLTAAPPLGQQTIRLPQTQTSRQVRVPSESQSSTESQMSSSTLEQLREFDLVLEQVKERSTVQPNGTPNSAFSKIHTSSSDATDGATSVISTPTETTQQVLYSIGNHQSLNVAYVNRKAVSTPTTSSYVRSPDSSGLADSPSSSTHIQIPHTVTNESSSSETPSHTKAAKVGSKSKSRPKASSNPPNTLKINTVPPKPSTQKPLEDEQTTQRILYILAEYKEQVENSPDKDKPAPRRRANAPHPGSSKRKKSSSGSRRSGGRDMSPIHGEDTCRTMGSEDSSCGTSQGDCNESCIDSHSPQDSPRKVVRKLTFEQDTPIVQPRPLPQRNVIVADGQTITVARGTAGKPTTAVLMPANYILPVSMVKGGQQIAIVTNRGPKLLTVGGEGGTTNALLLQRLIGPAGLKPVLTRPGVRHVRLPTAALHNLQAFNLATATTVQPPDSTASHSSTPAPPELIDTRASGSPWTDREDIKPDRGSSPEDSEPWNLASSADPHDYTYEETVRTDNMNRTVLDPIQDRYSPDMEAQRIFDKMFDVESKKSYMVNSPRCGYDIDASDCDDKAYHQVVHKKDGHRQHRLTHVSAAALRHKYAILEHELRLQKSLSEECEDLGVDSPSAAELFPEAELLFATSPAHDHTPDHGHHSHTPQPILMSGSSIPQPDMDDQIATDHLLTRDHISDDRQDLSGLEDVGIVTVSEDGMQATIALDQEEFARSHPNTTFHSEPDVGVVQPFTIAGLKTRHITSIFHANRAPGTVLMTAPQTTVISQATAEPHIQNAVKYSDIDNMINSLPAHSNNINLSSVLVKDEGLTRFDSILTDSRELHLSNNASSIIHSSGNATQVIRRVCYEDDKRERDTRFLMDEPEGLIAGNDAKMIAEDSSRDATLGSMTGDVDDDRSSPERHAELFWESNSASERSEGRRPLDFSSDSDKCCKSPSFDETNSTDSSGVGTHLRLDSVIKEARGVDRSISAGSSADDTHPPLRTYPPKRLYQPLEVEMERSVSGKTRAGERSPDVKRRASGRGVVKRGCHCCNGSPAPPRPKKSRQKKPTMDFTANN